MVKQSRAKILENMARARFGKLTVAEKQLIYGATGTTNRESTDRDNGCSIDPSKAYKWGKDRSIQARLIRWLFVEQSAREQLDPNGIQVCGARIEGPLNLSHIVMPFPLRLLKCSFTHNAEFRSLEVGLLSLAGSWTRNINAQGIRTKSDVVLNDGFHANGEVRLTGAQIDGNLDCSTGQFINPVPRSTGTSQKNNPALNAFNITVKGSVLLNNGFRAQGEVVLLDAQINGSLYCDGGNFINPESKNVEDSGKALTLSRSYISSNVYLTSNGHLKREFRAEGNVRLTGTRIAGSLDLQGSNFKNASLLLDEASVGSIHDDSRSWPEPGHLFLNGFVYGFMEPQDANCRLEWLSRQTSKPFYHQPYLQLAKVLGASGDDEGRRQVLIAMHDREPRTGRLDAFLNLSSNATVGYGYRPLRAFWEVLALSAVGWIIYRRSYLAGMIVPTDQEAYETFKAKHQPPNHYRKFFPSIYSLENTLPLVKLGQAEKWQPDPKQKAGQDNILAPRDFRSSRPWRREIRWVWKMLIYMGLLAPEKSNEPRSRLSQAGTTPRFVRWFLWAQILLGWLLATLFLAGISGIIRKD